MKNIPSQWFVFMGVFMAFHAFAAVRYVNVNSTNATAPYTSWATASTDIQDAIDASTNGDTVLVTNGIYTTGGRSLGGSPTNRVALDSALTVQSVNGPFVTIIQGAAGNLGPNAVRCAWLTNNATLVGFTLVGGGTLETGDINGCGGGVCCASSSAVVDNCVIVSNIASYEGSGAYQGTLNNCWISGNGSNRTYYIGGGAFGAVLNSCTVVSNTSGSGCSVQQCAMTNCIVYYNTAPNNSVANYLGVSSAAYCCTTPLPSGLGPGNFAAAPQVFPDGVHLLNGSPCIGAGTNLVTGTDIFGQTWANPPSVGCAEYSPAPLIAQPAVILTGNPLSFAVNAVVNGLPAPYVIWMKDGAILQTNGPFSFTQTTNLIVTGLSLTDAGNYQLVASNTFGVVTSSVVTLAIHCVNAAGLNPVSPYSNWTTAATNIQDAINASGNGDIVVVTNGLYNFGAQSMDGMSSNRVSLNNAIRVQSVNGPLVTTIQGGGATNGASAIRCAWLTNYAALVGFTLEGGATQTSGNTLASSGGGVFCASSNAFVYNCEIVSNVAYESGAGVYLGSYYNCLISSNRGASAAASALLNSCTIVSNINAAVVQGAATNCIIYNNLNNYSSLSAAAYCCTTPAISGPGNITNAPQFQPDGVHQASGSPCIHAGTNLVIGTDIFGLAWANPPSIGCAEFNASPTASQPQITLTGSPAGFAIGNVALTGQPPFNFTWLENGVPLQTNGHFSGTQTSNLVATGVSLADAGNYQLVVSNSSGAVTSAVAQLIVHAVNAAGLNPQAPFSTWATAATNIQSAIEAASSGDIVLVTNGIYNTGGEAMAGNLTNRVALDRALMVASVNGWTSAIIEGAWDPVSTNGPAAVRCAWLTNGAILSGFTLQTGATQNSGDTTAMQSGGGVLCASTNTLVANCLLSNNFANYGGGGIGFGTLNNSLVMNNVAASGGGAYNANLNNCTVEDNNTSSSFANGGGTYGGVVRNSLVLDNFDGYPDIVRMDNYQPTIGPSLQYSYCCVQSSTGQAPSGTGNVSIDPLLLDLYHISVNSPCRGAGSALYASGADLDGEAWNNPPSIGCDEVVVSNRVGPLSVAFSGAATIFPSTNIVLVGHLAFFQGTITGLASYLSWNFGDGPSITNVDNILYHEWTNEGTYNVVFTAYNASNPSGVSTNLMMQVVPVNPPQLQSPVILSNGLQFAFTAQLNATYTIQYATNLTPPVTWTTLQTIHGSSIGGLYQIQDVPPTNTARFYQIIAQ